MRRTTRSRKRGTLLLMIVGLLATFFLIISAYITLARFEKISLQSTSQAQSLDDVLDSVNEVVLGEVTLSWTDGAGNVLAGGRVNPESGAADVLDTYAPEDIPGFGGSRWLAGSEPVRDHGPQMPPSFTVAEGTLADIRVHKVPVSSFEKPVGYGGRLPVAGWLAGEVTPNAQPGLMLEDPRDTDVVFQTGDVNRNVRQPRMDADSDGVPDAFFTGLRSLSELANAVAGVPVTTPGSDFNPSAIPDPALDAEAARWRRFDESARYEVAVKIVSHGGMVCLDSPGDYRGSGSVWNREFSTALFNWIRHPNDNQWLYANDLSFNRISGSQAVLERYLRYRGGLLPTFAETQSALGYGTAVPAVLEDLEDRFPWTLLPDYNRPATWQRFNLAFNGAFSAEWSLWRQAAVLDADNYNRAFRDGGVWQANTSYVRRPLLTTVSHSDDLAREVDPTDPNPGVQGTLGLYPGQLKFFLGDIARAFNSDGTYRIDDYDGGIPRGNKIVRRLADYFYEMLADYDGWKTTPPQGINSEILTRRQQAFMLAVNTVAFAAPRLFSGTTGPLGRTAQVWYVDTADSGTPQRAYLGYSPQLFITEVAAVNEPDDEDQPHVALAVELYYPHEAGPNVQPETQSKFNNANDPFSLALGPFALSIKKSDESAPITRWPLQEVLDPFLARPVRLSGRNFLVFSFDDLNSNNEFENLGDGLPDGKFENSDVDIITLPNGHRGIVVQLWRAVDNDWASATGDAYCLVDEFTLDFGPGDPFPDDQPWAAFAFRDATPEWQFGGADRDGNGLIDRWARWGVVSNIGVGQAKNITDLSNYKSELGSGRPYAKDNESPTGLATRKAPSVPLCTMNAGDTDFNNPAPWYTDPDIQPLPRGFFTPVPLHGAYRPRSFPTVGFMLFVPRYAHTVLLTGTVERQPMSELLTEQWEHWDGLGDRQLSVAEGQYPADFGHMPIFDNHQEVREDSYFDSEHAGRLPWGLLVFDYFTTIDPYADYDGDGRRDIDPRRIPGRININTAPWYVLAGLPVLQPALLGDPTDATAPDPSFWSYDNGVLVGPAYHYPLSDGTALQRFDDPITSVHSLLLADGLTGWWRLGPYLAQAAAAYRDRLHYASGPYEVTAGGLNPLWAAAGRNDASLGTSYEYRNAGSGGSIAGYAYGPIRRGDGTETNPTKYGFLSLGELANVKGFDSPVFAANATGDPAQLLYNPLGRTVWEPTSRTPDFVKAVSLLALLDTHFLTTRSNTFTVYVTLTDRDPEHQQASVRRQFTIDRSNLLPTLLMMDTDNDGVPDTPRLEDTDGDGYGDRPMVLQNHGLPEIITPHEAGYFDTRFDY